MCFHAVNGSGPSYLSELLPVYTVPCTLCSSSDFRILKIQQYKCTMHSFCSCFGHYIWNLLPLGLRHCSTLSSLKTMLKIFPFLQYSYHS